MKFLVYISVLMMSISVTAQINQKDAQGLKQGVWKKAYPNSGVYQYVGQFKDDKPYGKFVYYYETGEVQAVIEFSSNGSVGYSKMYHESGYLMARGKYINQLKDSTWVYFDDRGIISYQEDYKAGKLNGSQIIYYEPQNGQYLVAKWYTYKDGKKHGEFKCYHPNTQLECEGSYESDKLHGTIKYYYPNGKYMRIERYNLGVKHGYWIFYNDQGTQDGYKLFWEGRELKGEELAKKEAELKQNR